LPPPTRPDEWFKVRGKVVNVQVEKRGEIKRESEGECEHDDDGEGKRYPK
jgi:hypothetical protein